MNPFSVGIDVSSQNNVAYLMKPDGSKHSSFSVQNNLGGDKLLSERIVSALSSMQLNDVVIGLEAHLTTKTDLSTHGRIAALAGYNGKSMVSILAGTEQGGLSRPAEERLGDVFVIANHLYFGRIVGLT